MTDLIIPLLLTLIGLAVALNAYGGVRRGGARFYTLEREAMLRRATLTLLASVFFFLAAIGYLIYANQQLQTQLAVESGELIESEPTPTVTLAVFPPTPEATATTDFTIPTPTNPPILRRGVVDGTGGSGLYLRTVPGGEQLEILPDGDIVTVLEEPSEEFDGFTWVKVRLVTGVEGWVVEDFLIVRDR